MLKNTATYTKVATGQKITVDKKACSNAMSTLSECSPVGANAACNTYKCKGGILDGQDCAGTAIGPCQGGGGMCLVNTPGMCTAYPFSGNPRGNDDYTRPGEVVPQGTAWLKLHKPPTSSPIWIDYPGFPVLPLGDTTKDGIDVKWQGDFKAFVNGAAGNPSCSCHFAITLDYDSTNKKYRAGTGLAIVNDADTMNCKLNP